MATRKIVVEEETYVFTLHSVDAKRVVDQFFLKSVPARSSASATRPSIGLSRAMPGAKFVSEKAGESKRMSLLSRTGEKPSTGMMWMRKDEDSDCYFDKYNVRSLLFTRFAERVNRRDGKTEDHTDVPCDWCRLQFDTQPFGVPVERRVAPEVVYWIEGNACCCECSYSLICEDQEKMPERRNQSYHNSEILLRGIFSKLFPDRELRRAMDWRLLKKNGGSLTPQDYRSSHSITRTHNMRFQSAEPYYEKSGS